MLKPDKLQEQLEEALKSTLGIAMPQIVALNFPENSHKKDTLMKQSEELMNELVAEPLSELLANIIDAYIKNISISGTLITNGSPSTHTCRINSTNVPQTNGSVPNTLGIS